MSHPMPPYINILLPTFNPTKLEYPHVYTHAGQWWFADETEGPNGPYATEIAARRGFDEYCKFYLNEEPIPEANNILKELVNNEKR